MIPTLLLSLSLHHHYVFASRVTCYRPVHRQQICVKIPVLRARHAAYGVWTKHERRFIHHKWRAVTVTFPILHPVARGTFTATMLITYYVDFGTMADGVTTYSGAAACGYDLALGTRVFVPGVGLLTCHDREGAVPYRHVDIFVTSSTQAAKIGLGFDYRRVTVYSP